MLNKRNYLIQLITCVLGDAYNNDDDDGDSVAVNAAADDERLLQV